MQFDFSEEQTALRDEGRRFFARACPLFAVRCVADTRADKDVPFDRIPTATAAGR